MLVATLRRFDDDLTHASLEHCLDHAGSLYGYIHERWSCHDSPKPMAAHRNVCKERG